MIHQNLEGEEIQHWVGDQLHQVIKCSFGDGIGNICEVAEVGGFSKIQ